MAFKHILLFTAVVAITLRAIEGHGRVTEPAHRGHAWRIGFNTPKDYDDNANFCGGFSVQHELNDGKCGLCGDNYANEQPRKNENHGILGTGTIVQTYTAGSEIKVNVQLTASHRGHFEFSLCPLNETQEFETEECFNAHRLELSSGGYIYNAVEGPRDYPIQLLLPKGLTCEHCVFRWHYHTGNNWGRCEDGSGALGCGNQENFRTCSDIRILDPQA